MPTVYFISDIHLGHKKILDFSPSRGGSCVDEHDEWIVDSWNSVVTKRDVVYLLGDIAFSREGLSKCADLNGVKKLILGNHDLFAIDEYTKYFKILPSLYKYKEFWLSHAPIHPHELRGKKNIHGHVHSSSITKPAIRPFEPSLNPRYINVCVEPLNGKPISIDKIRGINGS